MKKGKDKKDAGDASITPRPKEDGIKAVSIVPEMRESYLDYAMSVIVARALPDVRDGLKPVHRRILYSMHGLGLSHSARFRKSAMIVGDVLGKYHPHGDVSVYDAMVKLAQGWSTRYPMVQGQGNFGSTDGDSAAAYRYTEAKMSSMAGEMLRDIDRETVNFVPNYDGRLDEPVVLPSALPNLLLNGTLGIAVGMATKIPPHNLREVVDALSYLIDNEDATTEDLMKFVKGPDFPTGAVAFSKTDILHAYASGRGGVVVRGEAEIVEEKAGSSSIVITSIPYQLNKAELIIKMADLVREKKIEGVRDIRDESTEFPDTRIVIELKSGVFPQKVLNALYKMTELEQTFHYNMLALVDGVPKMLTLKSMLAEFVKHREIVVRRRAEFDLRKAKERAHILEGLKKALDHIDEIIKLIKKSKDVETAKDGLMKSFKFSDLQAVAILEMRLQKLAGLERKKIEDELLEKQKLIKELMELLASAKRIRAVVKDEAVALSLKYGDERRTKIMSQGVKEIKPEDLIPETESVLVLTRGGYIKRTDPSEYRSQKRGGVGVVDLNTKEEDFVAIFLTANTHSDLLFFSDKGKAYQIKMYDIPEGKRATKGKSVMNFLQLVDNERVSSVLAMPKDTKWKDISLFMTTRKGVVKKSAAASFADVRRSGLIAITLDNGDELLCVQSVSKGDDVSLATRLGQSIRFKSDSVREMGRTAGGVRGIKLEEGDAVVGADVISKDGAKDGTLLVLGEHGYGKRTALSEYKVQGRAGSGIKTMAVTKKTGELVYATVVDGEDEEIVAISKNGQVIRTSLASIPVLGRSTQGVRVMKLREGDKVAGATFL
ncbi:MAG: DNA gyrase subunit A [Candidatus Vogelbacteria bacterium CG10_big_fil_rev_8_21_14_0_10_45_14]|uniref:DNA gyrase subunit A n=1 Tax=Candidatus Vogelbacteria bacterium CG10_big_fil_rev_8_21_14_0_10_45_14 TaxID=1975042 RepID=A0A2H0RML2_9BACT|nr:MAG: DNA gyrase subunit A [Candidatus Vogelbacteria bacterium CG10_big_fil_rev_8_21_14_0_10_45_14]